jgi:acetolactate synthase-1/2/3 large subunit
VFGYPGGAVLNIYDEFFKQDKVKHVLVRPRAGRRPCGRRLFALEPEDRRLAGNLGPGVTNAVTGIATAYMDSMPMVIITGQVRRMRSARTRSRNATRSASRGRASSTTSWSRTSAEPGVDDQEGVPHRADGTARAGAGRHPEGRHASSRASSATPERVELRSYSPVTRGHSGQIRKAVQLCSRRSAR